MPQEKSKTMPMQFFFEGKEVYYGIVQVENASKFKINVMLRRKKDGGCIFHHNTIQTLHTP